MSFYQIRGPLMDKETMDTFKFLRAVQLYTMVVVLPVHGGIEEIRQLW
jgi:hypothetical protein